MTQTEIKKRIKETEALLAVLRGYPTDTYYKELKRKVREHEERWWKKNEAKREELQSQVRLLKDELRAAKESNEIKIPDYIKAWLKEYHYGVDWGHGGLKIRWISEDEKWAIITNGGGTAGQGTAMGTGGYYYANCSHFLGCIEHSGSMDNRYAEIEGGRLTQERKAALIASIPEVERSEKFKRQNGPNPEYRGYGAKPKQWKTVK